MKRIVKTDDAAIEKAVKRAQEALVEGKKSNLDIAAMQKLEAAARFALAQQIAKARQDSQWWALSDLNRRPADYESDALAELGPDETIC